MRNYKKSFWCSRCAGIAFSAFLGTAASFVLIMLLSAFTLFFMDDMSASGYFCTFSLSAGSLFGGFVCGKFRRLKGLAEGALCGLIMYIIISIVILCIFGEFMGIKKLLLIMAFSAAGGVIGVNSKRPNKLRTDT